MLAKNFYAFLLSSLLVCLLVYLKVQYAKPAMLGVLFFFGVLSLGFFSSLNENLNNLVISKKYIFLLVNIGLFIAFASLRVTDLHGAVILFKYILLFSTAGLFVHIVKKYQLLDNRLFKNLVIIVLFLFYLFCISFFIINEGAGYRNVIACAVLLLMPIAYYYFREIAILTTVAIIVLVQARTNLGAIVIFPIIYGYFLVVKNKRLRIISFYLFLISLLLGFMLYLNLGDSGKTLINLISQKYFLIHKGYGSQRLFIYHGILDHVGLFSFFGEGLSVWPQTILGLPLTAHNQFLSVYLKLGYVGLFLFLGLFDCSFRLNVNNPFILSYIMMAMIISLMEVTILGASLSLNMFFWVTVFYVGPVEEKQPFCVVFFKNYFKRTRADAVAS